jgi:hypothetical protein
MSTDITVNENLQNAEQKTSRQFLTDREIFEKIKPKISKYGEDVINSLAKDYSKGIAFDESVVNNLFDEIEEKARNAKHFSDIDKRKQEIYTSFGIDAKTAEQNLVQLLQEKESWQEMSNEEKKELLENPSFIKASLKEYNNLQKIKQLDFQKFGTTSNNETVSRFDELSLKRGSQKGLSAQELQEYQNLLEQKYSQKIINK